MDSTLSIIVLLSCVIQVSGMDCYTCNDIQHANKCQENATLTPKDTKHITPCRGTCFIGKLGDAKRSSIARGCVDDFHKEVVEILDTPNEKGYKCHCNTDFCNFDLDLCKSPRLGSLKSTATTNQTQKMVAPIVFIIFYQICYFFALR